MSNLKLNQGQIDKAITEATAFGHEMLDSAMTTLLKEVKQSIDGLDTAQKSGSELLQKATVAYAFDFPEMFFDGDHRRDVGVRVRIGHSEWDVTPRTDIFRQHEIASGQKYRALFFLLPIDG